MKKNLKSGFTLTEAVITMTIIGVVSAFLLPMANKFRPDPVKVKYLQTYDAITYVASQLANDSTKFGLYERFSLNGNESDILLDKVPFFNKPEKFCENFILGVNAPAGTKCSEPEEGTNNKNSSATFTTSNGIDWKVEAHSNYNAGAISKTEFSAVITTVIDGQNFMFVVGADGQTHIADSQGLAYAATRSSWKNADYDLSKHNISLKTVENKANRDLLVGLGDSWVNLYLIKQPPTPDEPEVTEPATPEIVEPTIPGDDLDPITPIGDGPGLPLDRGDEVIETPTAEELAGDYNNPDDDTSDDGDDSSLGGSGRGDNLSVEKNTVAVDDGMTVEPNNNGWSDKDIENQ